MSEREKEIHIHSERCSVSYPDAGIRLLKDGRERGIWFKHVDVDGGIEANQKILLEWDQIENLIKVLESELKKVKMT